MVTPLSEQPSPSASSTRSVLVWVSGALISAAAVTYIYYLAAEEPFISMPTRTLVTLEGLGFICVLLFGFWARAAVRAARQIRPAKRAVPITLVVVAWTLVCLAYLVLAMLGCLQDYQNFRNGVPGTLGGIETSRSPRP